MWLELCVHYCLVLDRQDKGAKEGGFGSLTSLAYFSLLSVKCTKHCTAHTHCQYGPASSLSFSLLFCFPLYSPTTTTPLAFKNLNYNNLSLSLSLSTSLLNHNGWTLTLSSTHLNSLALLLMGSGAATNTKPPSSPPNSSSESLNGLKFGQKIYFEDVGLATPATFSSSSSAPKKGRGGSVQPAQPPRCQVEGCKVDLSDAKAYYSRHKVCGMHSKSPTVIVAGLHQRFCQQCSRFHQLPEFDQGKRSCRRRLAGHNERRRKPPPNSLLTSRYARHSLPIFDNSSRGGSFLMEFASYPKLSPRNSLPTPRSSEPVPGNQTVTLTWQGNSEVSSDLFLQGSVSGTSFPGPRHPPGESYTGVTDSSCALSLLSSQTWGSRNTAPSLGVNNNMLNFNGTPVTQLAASSHGAAIHQLPNTSWCFKGIDPSNCSHEVVPDLGLGQISQPLNGQLPGELDVSQQGRRHYMDVEQARAYESPHWSL